jgi:cell division transport system permease protein
VDPTFLPWPVALGMVGAGAVLGMTAAALGLRKLVAV